MIYNFSTDIHATDTQDIDLNFCLPYNSRNAKVVKWLINDDCNFFDEWQEDRKKHKITNDAFQWSPDDGQVEVNIILNDQRAKNIYREQLREKYIKCSELKPETQRERIKRRNYSETIHLASNNVMFIQITKR